MSDSDLSEVESDTQHDSRMAANILDFDGAIDCDPNGNSIVDSGTDSEREDNLNKVAEILRTVFESNSSHLLSAIETLAEKEHIDGDMKCGFEDDKFALTECMIDCDDFSTMVGSPPPDILQKSSSSESGFESSAEKPDILLNVSDEALSAPTLLTVEKDESNSITPVDIVGNFEQEVQREFGLLVTRYKSNKRNNDATHERMMNKVRAPVTATLWMAFNFHIFCLLPQVLDAKLSHADEEIRKVGTFTRPSGDGQPESMRTTHTVTRDGKIPMAIVKPKYQRSSFDERQLPAIAFANPENAWYDKPKQADGSSTPSKKVTLPEMGDKNPFKPCKMIAAHKSANNATKADHERGTTDTRANEGRGDEAQPKPAKKKGSSVAVVQPRKKEKMDERELMQIIVQMQIKKNARMNRGQSSANQNHAKSSADTKANGHDTKSAMRKLRKHPKDEPGKWVRRALRRWRWQCGAHSNLIHMELGCFDVYNIETSLPSIDPEFYEQHLKAIRDDERRVSGVDLFSYS